MDSFYLYHMNNVFDIIKRPILIAGPCSVETEEQFIETALRLKAAGNADILRGGIWKPRTRPNSFEGIGAKGLPWMVKAREQTGIPLTVEVAKARHVELCLDFGIDMLWIGARTTVNPFAVQEIADALRGTNTPIMVKNPINPDLALWLGAVERLEKVGLEQIGAIHRGFSNYSEHYYRNRPNWQIPIAFREARPEIPMLCDPSHICGRRDTLYEVSQTAMDLNFDGLMVESHITPDEAWSDAAQQITPEVLKDLIQSIVVRDDEFQDKALLHEMRQDIDSLDDQIVQLLGERMKLALKVGKEKKAQNITILDEKRWKDIRDKYHERGLALGLGANFLDKLVGQIHLESIKQQSKYFQKK